MKYLLQDSTYVDFIKAWTHYSLLIPLENRGDQQGDQPHQHQQCSVVCCGRFRKAMQIYSQQYIYQSNQYILDVNAEISLLKDRITDTYKKRLPDLAVELPNTMDYIRAVERIGNHTVWSSPQESFNPCVGYYGIEI